MAFYKVWDENEMIEGTPEEILRKIISKNQGTEIGKMSPRKYARTLIDNASYFLPAEIVETLKYAYENDKDSDKDMKMALRVLDLAPSSGTHIMSDKSVN